MNKYTITIKQEKDTGNDYSSHETIYEQTVDADERLVFAVIHQVLDYMSKTKPLVIKTGGKADEGANNEHL